MKETNELLKRLKELGYDSMEEFENDKELHKADLNSDAPALYVGTYAKYNSGSLSGMWVDLTTFYDCDDFLNFCNALHADEKHPELMFQDFQNMPKAFYCESGISAETFGKINDYYELCQHYDKAAVDAYIDNTNNNVDMDGFENDFCGEYDSKTDFAQEMLPFDEIESKIGYQYAMYFDYEAFARDLFINDYVYNNGYVFRMQ